MKKVLSIAEVTELRNQGLSYNAIGNKLGVDYQRIYRLLKKADAETKSPQQKAWVTRKKQEAIEAYNTATSTGKKARIARIFNVEFGVDIKTLIEAPKVKAPNTPKAPNIENVDIKRDFNEKMIAMAMPPIVKQMFEELRNEIAELKAMLKK